MSKKLIISILVVGLMLLSVPMVLGATNQSANPEIAKLQQQIADMQKQLVQKYVESGKITADQGKAMQDRIDQQAKAAQANGFQPGIGCGGVSGSVNGGCGVAGGAVNGGCGGFGAGRGAGSATPQSFNNL